MQRFQAKPNGEKDAVNGHAMSGINGVPQNGGFEQIPAELFTSDGSPGAGVDGKQFESFTSGETPPEAENGAEYEVAQGEKSCPQDNEPKRGRGRPCALDAQAKSTVCLLLSLGLSRRQAAAYTNVSHVTIANEMKRDENFAAEAARSEQMSVIKPVITIASAAQNNWRAAAWLLRRNEQRLARTADGHKEAVQESRQEGERMLAMFDALASKTDQPPKA